MLAFILSIEEEVVPVKMQNAGHARQVFVNGRNLGHVIDEAVKGCIDQPASRRRFEKLFQLAAMYVNAKLQGVIGCRMR